MSTGFLGVFKGRQDKRNQYQTSVMTTSEKFLLAVACCVFIVLVQGQQSCTPQRYRSFNGECNNLIHRTWGSSFTAERRFRDANGNLMVEYGNGNAPRGGFISTLPSPRAVSNLLSDEHLSNPNQPDNQNGDEDQSNSNQGSDEDMSDQDQFDKRRSAQTFAFGQLLAHDVIATKGGPNINCCDPSQANNPDCFPIIIPANDDDFQDRSCINFVRTAAANDSSIPHREQINEATSFVDASQVYGSTEVRANQLRVPNSFLMSTDVDNLLPTEPSQFADFCVKSSVAVKCPLAGDSRVSEIPNLGLNHLLWLREHNRIATYLDNLNPNWSDDKVFQETRRIVIALWQHIVYNEYLPSVLGLSTAVENGLLSKKSGFANVYDNTIDPSVRNEFGAAPMRLGHTQLVNNLLILGKDFSEVSTNPLETLFNNPSLLQQNHGSNMEGLARFLTYRSCMKIDNFAVDAIRNKLFANSGPAQDLFSRNIQRGRDQGVPGYNKWRKFCGLDAYNSFERFGKYGKTLKTLYNNRINDVDLFIGGLLEQGPKGALGPTFACILSKQYQLLKIGDRFWYERNDPISGFTLDQLNSIKDNALLSKMICRHFNLDRIQMDVFTPGKKSALIKCDDLPEIDLNLWSD